LVEFQETIDAANVVVTLKGTTRDNAALHIYLGQLGRSRLFAKVELLAIESSETTPGGTSRFGARLTVRSGYGQRSGPTPAESALRGPLAPVLRGEGRGEGSASRDEGPHPNPLPEYREREIVMVRTAFDQSY
jgi:hypothetical protein